MEMLNRAFEDASAFTEFQKKLLEGQADDREKMMRAMTRETPGFVTSSIGENRTQRRARERAEKKAALRAART